MRRRESSILNILKNKVKPLANWETLLRKHCFLPMFRHVSQSGQTLGNISEKHRETSNVSEFAEFSGSKFCFRNNVSTGGQTGKHLRKHHESQMFPQQCFLVCPGLKSHLMVASFSNLTSYWSASFSYHGRRRSRLSFSTKLSPTRLTFSQCARASRTHL